ncbi:MAG: oxygenase MpaB family protein [Candidatus Rokuibacteriota bacterium]
MRPLLPAEPFVPAGIACHGISRRIHQERVLLAGWGRAILLQIAHPKVARGVAEHSGFATEPRGRLRRLRRTLDAMLALTFGSAEETAGVTGRIKAIHDRVHGRLEEAGGGAAAGASYSAHDPELLTWVHATLIESHLLTYRLFVGPVTAAEADRYCVEASGIEPALGIPAGRLPRSEAALRGYLDAMLASGAIEVTDTARWLSREILAPPAPRIVRPALWLAALPAVGLLPPAIRAGYRVPWNGRHERALRIVAGAARAGLPLVPPGLRYWAVARRAERRARSGR